MKLYIFRPHEKWNYCGGSIIIIAENFNDCKKIFDLWGNYEDKCNMFFKEDEDTEYPYWDTWVLQEELEVNCELEPRVVLCNFNYA